MKHLKLIALIGLLSMALWVPAAPALAYPLDVITGTGTFNSLPVSVSVQFITSPNTVEVKIWNNQADPKSDIQCLSGLGFVLSTGQTSGSITSSWAIARTIEKSGIYKDENPATSSHWLLDSNVDMSSAGYAGSGLKLDDLSGNGVPNTIIGPPNANGNKYSNAKGSIATPPHEPLWFGTAAQPVDFVLQVNGVTDLTTVSFVQFSFGTSSGSDINVYPPPPPTPTPVPASVLLLGSGLLALAVLRLKRKAVPVKEDIDGN